MEILFDSLSSSTVSFCFKSVCVPVLTYVLWNSHQRWYLTCLNSRVFFISLSEEFSVKTTTMHGKEGSFILLKESHLHVVFQWHHCSQRHVAPYRHRVAPYRRHVAPDRSHTGAMWRHTGGMWRHTSAMWHHTSAMWRHTCAMHAKY